MMVLRTPVHNEESNTRDKSRAIATRAVMEMFRRRCSLRQRQRPQTRARPQARPVIQAEAVVETRSAAEVEVELENGQHQR